MLTFLYWVHRLCVSNYAGLRETLQNICVSYEVAKYLVLKKRSINFFLKPLTNTQFITYCSTRVVKTLRAPLYGVILV